MKAPSPSCWPGPARRHGVVLAEFTLLLPVLMLLVLLCIDFGQFAYTYIALKNAARAGAGYGIMNPYLPATQAAWEGRIQQTARDEMAQQTGYVSDNLTTSTTVTVETNGLRRVRVVATYSSFRTIVAWPGIPSQVALQAAAEMRSIR